MPLQVKASRQHIFPNAICGTLAAQEQRPAASLLGVILAKRPSISDFLVGEGALKAVVQLLVKGAPASDFLQTSLGAQSSCQWSRYWLHPCALLPRLQQEHWAVGSRLASCSDAQTLSKAASSWLKRGLSLWASPAVCQKHVSAGDAQTADVAVAAAWGLVKGNQRLLRPEAEALGVPGTALVAPLLDIILRAKVRIADCTVCAPAAFPLGAVRHTEALRDASEGSAPGLPKSMLRCVSQSHGEPSGARKPR